MLRMRPNNPVLPLVAATAVAATLAVPAFAAEATEIKPRRPLAKIAAWAGEVKLPKPTPGPFVPIEGKVDFGTAENAFGAARSGHTHAGQDMFAPSGTPLIAATDAVVIDAGADGGQGNYVHLYDPKRKRTYVYMHMIEPAAVKQGDEVKAGERVGGVGCTGSCWGNHLHFEVRDGRGFTAEAINPMPMLRDWHQKSG